MGDWPAPSDDRKKAEVAGLSTYAGIVHVDSAVVVHAPMHASYFGLVCQTTIHGTYLWHRSLSLQYGKACSVLQYMPGQAVSAIPNAYVCCLVAQPQLVCWLVASRCKDHWPVTLASAINMLLVTAIHNLLRCTASCNA